ncbi:MAG: hypothetical protein QM736_15675 [Vicinamibacterales bacterium]
MWSKTSISVASRPVTLSVRLVDGEEAERAAALVAWFCEAASAPRQDDERRESGAFMQALFDRIRFDVPDEDVPRMNDEWWREASWRAVAEFLRVNGLWPRVCHHLRAAATAGVRPRA